MSNGDQVFAPSPSRRCSTASSHDSSFTPACSSSCNRRIAATARARELLRDLLVEPRRVLPGARRRPAGTGRGRTGRPVCRWAHAAAGAGSDPRARPGAVGAAVPTLEEGKSRPALEAQGIVGGSKTSVRSDREARKRFHREVYPVLTPLAVGPGQPFPYISGLSLSLAIFAEDPEVGEAGSHGSRSRKGCRALQPRSRPLCAARADHRLPCRRFPASKSSSARCSASHATRTSRSRTTPPTSSRRSRASSAAAVGDVVRVEVSLSASSEMVARLQSGLERRDADLSRRRSARPVRAEGAVATERPS